MANYDTTLKYINDSSKSEFFVAEASAGMDCPTLAKNAQTLSDQITMWKGKLASGNSKEKANLSTIISNQQKKLDNYSALYSSMCAVNKAPSPAGSQAQVPGAGTLPAATTAAAQSTTATTATSSLIQKVKTIVHEVPPWAWAAGGIAVAGVLTLIIVKKIRS